MISLPQMFDNIYQNLTLTISVATMPHKISVMFGHEFYMPLPTCTPAAVSTGVSIATVSTYISVAFVSDDSMCVYYIFIVQKLAD